MLYCSLFTHSDIASTPADVSALQWRNEDGRHPVTTPGALVLFSFLLPSQGLETKLPSPIAKSIPDQNAVFILSYWPLSPIAAHSLLASGGVGAGDGMTWHFTGYLHMSNCVFCVRRAACAGQKSPGLIRTWAKCRPVYDFRVE